MTGWTLTLPCNRAEAEALPETGEIFGDLASPPTLLVDEPDPDQPDAWVLTAYLDAEPDAALVARIAALAPSAAPESLVLAPLPDADWTTLSQRDLEPVRAGRFLVHTAAHSGAVRLGDRAIRIEAGLAFGTGQHATTHGCLAALDALGRSHSFTRIVDLGTGTGVLALAAAKRWPRAQVIASDIDPVAIDVTRANLRDNKVPEGRTPGRIELAVHQAALEQDKVGIKIAREIAENRGARAKYAHRQRRALGSAVEETQRIHQQPIGKPAHRRVE